VLRTISNWRRLKRFCQRHQLSYNITRKEISQQFCLFLENEIQENQKEQKRNTIDCSFDDLTSFALELGTSIQHLEKSLKPLCRDWS